MRARFVEEAKPKKITFNLTWDAKMVVEEALKLAREHTGTPHKSQALEHLCQDYLAHGPHARSMESIVLKNQLLNARLETLMEQAGPGEVIETFNRVFPAQAILDFPK